MSSMARKRHPQKRLSREERHSQLIETARRIVLQAGTDSLTLGRLAEEGNVSKPVVYDHFENRSALLAALYADYDLRQSDIMHEGLAACPLTLDHRASLIAKCYVECVLSEGKEIPGVAAALSGSPEMEAVRRSYQNRFIAKCRDVLEPFSRRGTIPAAAFWAMMGAADGLAAAAATGEITKDEAVEELINAIRFVVDGGIRAS